MGAFGDLHHADQHATNSRGAAGKLVAAPCSWSGTARPTSSRQRWDGAIPDREAQHVVVADPDRARTSDPPSARSRPVSCPKDERRQGFGAAAHPAVGSNEAPGTATLVRMSVQPGAESQRSHVDAGGRSPRACVWKFTIGGVQPRPAERRVHVPRAHLLREQERKGLPLRRIGDPVGLEAGGDRVAQRDIALEDRVVPEASDRAPRRRLVEARRSDRAAGGQPERERPDLFSRKHSHISGNVGLEGRFQAEGEARSRSGRRRPCSAARPVWVRDVRSAMRPRFPPEKTLRYAPSIVSRRDRIAAPPMRAIAAVLLGSSGVTVSSGAALATPVNPRRSCAPPVNARCAPRRIADVLL